MAEPKTQPTAGSVKAFLDAIADPARKADCQALVKLMKGVTKAEPVLWGANIVGFGSYQYSYPSGRTADWFLLGFSPRKKDISVYVLPGLAGMADVLTRLGPHKMGKGCLYLNNLADIDAKALKELLARAAAQA